MATVFRKIHGGRPDGSAALTQVVIDNNDQLDEKDPGRRPKCDSQSMSMYAVNKPPRIHVCPATYERPTIRDTFAEVCKSSQISPAYVVMTHPIDDYVLTHHFYSMKRAMGSTTLHEITLISIPTKNCFDRSADRPSSHIDWFK